MPDDNKVVIRSCNLVHTTRVLNIFQKICS